MEAERDHGIMGLMGLTGQVLILIVQVTSTMAALTTALESLATGTTPTTALILTRLLLTGRSPISLTLPLSASVGRRRRTMVITHLHHRITVITRLLLLRLLTVLGLRRRRHHHHHHHHMAISHRLPAPGSVLLRLLRLPTALLDSGRACSASYIPMDPHRRCPGSGQIGSTRLRTAIRIMVTDTDMREDHLAWGMTVTTALPMNIMRKSMVTMKANSIPMSPSDWMNPRESPITWHTTITSLPTISENLRSRPRSQKLTGKADICLKLALRGLKMPGLLALRTTITPTCPGRLSSDGKATTGPRRTTDPMTTMSSTVTTLPHLGLRPLALLHLDLPHLLDIIPTARHLTVRFSFTSPQRSLP